MFNHPFTGQELRNSGMQVALEHANQVHANWSEHATKALDTFLKSHRLPFMTEDVRKYAYETLKLEEAPHPRAWGPVMEAASKTGKIVHAGYAKVKNPKAHRATASVWIGV